MKEVNEDVKKVVNPKKVIKTSPIIRNESFFGSKEQPKQRYKKDYTTAIVWTVLSAVTVTLWSLIYYLFSY